MFSLNGLKRYTNYWSFFHIYSIFYIVADFYLNYLKKYWFRYFDYTLSHHAQNIWVQCYSHTLSTRVFCFFFLKCRNAWNHHFYFHFWILTIKMYFTLLISQKIYASLYFEKKQFIFQIRNNVKIVLTILVWFGKFK